MHIVFLTLAIPPVNFNGGRRCYYLAKELVKMGHQATIICRQWAGTEYQNIYIEIGEKINIENRDGIQIISLPNKLFYNKHLFLKYTVALENSQNPIISKIFRTINFFSSLEYQIRFVFPLEEIVNILKNQSVDFIIASGTPWFLFEYGSLLASHLKCKLIYDYRDPWNVVKKDIQFSGWDEYRDNPISQLKKFIQRKREKDLLKKCDGIIAISNPILQNIFMLAKRKMKGMVLTQAFTYEEFLDYKEKVQIDPQRLLLCFAGSLWPDQRVEIFVKALLNLYRRQMINSSNFQVHIIGADLSKDKRHEKIISEFPDKKILSPIRLVPRDEAKKILAQSDVLLFWGFKGKKGIYSSKIFEYLALNKPILCIQSDHDVVEDLLSKTKTGIFANSIEETEKVLIELLHLKQQFGKIPFHPNANEIAKYTYESKAKELINFLRTFYE